MTRIAIILIIAAFLPLLTALIAKLGANFDNHHPRAWLSQQTGYRARANAAQANGFEALPFFYAATLFALYNQANQHHLLYCLIAWIVLRILFIICYLLDQAAMRSAVWGLALATNIAILFV